MMRRREKVFGPGHAVPLDKNAKARVTAYARAWSARHRQPGQHKGPITRAFLEVLEALLWGFHNTRSGICYPSYERVAERAGCARSTVAEAIKVLETAGVLSWQHRITRIQQKCTDLFGKSCWRWRVIRTSNAYCFHDPKAAAQAGIPSKSDFRLGTLNQDSSVASGSASPTISTAPSALTSRATALQQALGRLGAAIAAKDCIEQEGAAAA